MPELTLKGYWDGSLASGIDAFYSDTFPFRDALISLGSTLEEMRGLRLDDAKIHETAPSTSEPEVPTEPGSGTETENSSSSKAEETAVGEQNGSVFIYKAVSYTHLSVCRGSTAIPVPEHWGAVPSVPCRHWPGPRIMPYPCWCWAS